MLVLRARIQIVFDQIVICHPTLWEAAGKLFPRTVQTYREKNFSHVAKFKKKKILLLRTPKRECGEPDDEENFILVMKNWIFSLKSWEA